MSDEKQGPPRIKGVILGEYKGKPTLSIPVGQANEEGLYWPMTFGLSKAQAILDNLRSIEKFVASEGKAIGDDLPF